MNNFKGLMSTAQAMNQAYLYQDQTILEKVEAQIKEAEQRLNKLTVLRDALKSNPQISEMFDLLRSVEI